eukprot:CAMPEP_0181388992 /NCGR_PEP_ID=MMETSP1106-20121128/24638_1 /TAXON_ID=81844 /ORGANISM="Mantoniella antarctica, Strain SL-175" /LENGTH=38 /DNA_ID= /DNA_START= /DNA_END= /DNA_ORIENTATION=
MRAKLVSASSSAVSIGICSTRWTPSASAAWLSFSWFAV